jgi:hypothetical protein
MLHPLASLWRHNARVTFYESGGAAGEHLFQGGAGTQSHVAGARRRFVSADEAYLYLRYWMGEPAARAELMWILQRSGPTLVGSGTGAQAWLHALAGRLVAGAIVVLEENNRAAMPGRLVAPQVSAADAAAAIADLPQLTVAAPAIPVIPDVLPMLEEIRIEGAEVLPELDQSLAQVDTAIATVGATGLSLEPAPAKVAQIGAAITEATDQANAALDRL